MNMDELKKRKTPRYQSFDYNNVGVYFITICTQNRRSILSHIVGADVSDGQKSPNLVATGVSDGQKSPNLVGTSVSDGQKSSNLVETGVSDGQKSPNIVGTGVLDCPQVKLTKYGKIADKYIKQLDGFYNNLSVENYVIMPNHIHLLLWVKENKNTKITLVQIPIR